VGEILSVSEYGFSVYINGGTPELPGMTLAFSIAVRALHDTVFVAGSWTVFNRRDLAS